MKQKMIFTTCVLLAVFAICLPVFLITKNDIALTVTITVGVTLYHFAMRLAVGYIINAIMKNKANYNNAWFCEKRFESKLYKLLGVREWKKYLPTYSPDTFEVGRNTVKQIIGATCQAEIVHEIIIVFSALPIILIPFLGGAAALIITSVLAMLFDLSFVILQRYNRPRLVRITERLKKRN